MAELACLGADQVGQRDQHVSHGQRAVAGVERQVGQRGPDDVETGADTEIERALKGRTFGPGPVAGDGEDGREHHAHGHRNAPLAPGHGQKGQEREEREEDAQFQVPAVEQLDDVEHGHTGDEGQHHRAQLAPAWRGHVRRRDGDDADGGERGRIGAQPVLDDERYHQQSQTGGDAIGDVVAEQDAQEGAGAGGELQGTHGELQGRPLGQSEHAGGSVAVAGRNGTLFCMVCGLAPTGGRWSACGRGARRKSRIGCRWSDCPVAFTEATPSVRSVLPLWQHDGFFTCHGKTSWPLPIFSSRRRKAALPSCSCCSVMPASPGRR